MKKFIPETVVYDVDTFMIAWGKWIDEDGSESQLMGIRWRGDKNNPIGFPQSRGKEVWLVVPEEISDMMLKGLLLINKGDQKAIYSILT